MSLSSMVRKSVVSVIDGDQVLSPSLIACSVVENISEGFSENDDGALARIAAFSKCRDLARHQINSFGPPTQGLERLQSHYVMQRDGDDLAVPITLCTDEELEARAAELVKMAKGSLAHAKEIRAYIASRPAVAA